MRGPWRSPNAVHFLALTAYLYPTEMVGTCVTSGCPDRKFPISSINFFRRAHDQRRCSMFISIPDVAPRILKFSDLRPNPNEYFAEYLTMTVASVLSFFSSF